MIYSEVVNKGWILPKKRKYTMRDVNKVILDSLLGKYGNTLSVRQSLFIVKCSAIYHDTDYSNAIAYYKDKLPIGRV